MLSACFRVRGIIEMKKRNGGVVLAAIVVIGIGAVIIGYQLWQDVTAASTYEKLEMVVVTKHSVETPAWYEQGSVDFATLSEENSDVVGWIWIDGLEDVSYPILQGADDETYLHQDLFGQKLKAGSIFLEAANARDFSDWYSIIYGHNMRDGSMFGTLKNYREEGFYEAHSFFTIATPQGMYHYKIFGYEEVAEDDVVYTIGFGADDNYGEFLQKLLTRSYRDCGVEVTQNDHVITLSTCSSTGRRFVVHGVLQETHAN